MGKQKQTQPRVKANQKPASSSRAAELIGDTGAIDAFKANPLLGFSQFVPASTSSSALSQAAKLSSKAAKASSRSGSATPTGDELGNAPTVDPELGVILKRLTKRDSATKCKALDELSAYASTLGIENRSAEYLHGLLVAWCGQFSRLAVLDTDRRVRLMTMQTHKVITSVAGRQLAPHLRELLPPWLASCFDQARDVSKLANDVLMSTFTPPKDAAAIGHCFGAIVDYVIDMVVRQTVDTINDPRFVDEELRKDNLTRAVSASLSAFAHAMQLAPEPAVAGAMSKIEALFASPALWATLSDSRPAVRRASCAMVASLLADANDEQRQKNSAMFEPHVQQLAEALIHSGLQHPDPSAANREWWKALLAASNALPQIWNVPAQKKPVSRRLCDYIGDCGENSQMLDSSLQNMVELVKLIPVEFFDAKSYTGISTSAWDAIVKCGSSPKLAGGSTVSVPLTAFENASRLICELAQRMSADQAPQFIKTQLGHVSKLHAQTLTDSLSEGLSRTPGFVLTHLSNGDSSFVNAAVSSIEERVNFALDNIKDIDASSLSFIVGQITSVNTGKSRLSGLAGSLLDGLLGSDSNSFSHVTLVRNILATYPELVSNDRLNQLIEYATKCVSSDIDPSAVTEYTSTALVAICLKLITFDSSTAAEPIFSALADSPVCNWRAIIARGLLLDLSKKQQAADADPAISTSLVLLAANYLNADSNTVDVRNAVSLSVSTLAVLDSFLSIGNAATIVRSLVDLVRSERHYHSSSRSVSTTLFDSLAELFSTYPTLVGKLIGLIHPFGSLLVAMLDLAGRQERSSSARKCLDVLLLALISVSEAIRLVAATSIFKAFTADIEQSLADPLYLSEDAYQLATRFAHAFGVSKILNQPDIATALLQSIILYETRWTSATASSAESGLAAITTTEWMACDGDEFSYALRYVTFAAQVLRLLDPGRFFFTRDATSKAGFAVSNLWLLGSLTSWLRVLSAAPTQLYQSYPQLPELIRSVLRESLAVAFKLSSSSVRGGYWIESLLQSDNADNEEATNLVRDLFEAASTPSSFATLFSIAMDISRPSPNAFDDWIDSVTNKFDSVNLVRVAAAMPLLVAHQSTVWNALPLLGLLSTSLQKLSALDRRALFSADTAASVDSALDITARALNLLGSDEDSMESVPVDSIQTIFTALVAFRNAFSLGSALSISISIHKRLSSVAAGIITHCADALTDNALFQFANWCAEWIAAAPPTSTPPPSGSPGPSAKSGSLLTRRAADAEYYELKCSSVDLYEAIVKLLAGDALTEEQFDVIHPSIIRISRRVTAYACQGNTPAAKDSSLPDIQSLSLTSQRPVDRLVYRCICAFALSARYAIVDFDPMALFGFLSHRDHHIVGAAYAALSEYVRTLAEPQSESEAEDEEDGSALVAAAASASNDELATPDAVQSPIFEPLLDIMHQLLEQVQITYAAPSSGADTAESMVPHLSALYRYMLSWMLIFDHFRACQSFATRLALLNRLKSVRPDLLPGLFGTLFQVLGVHSSGNISAVARSSPFNVSLYSIADFDPSAVTLDKADNFGEVTIDLLAAHVLGRAFSDTPLLVRSWLLTCTNRQLISSVETFAIRHYCPAIIRSELAAIESSVDVAKLVEDDDRIATATRSTVSQAVIQYQIDDAKLEITFQIPPAYPLRSVDIDPGNRAGVNQRQWNTWMLNASIGMQNQNGSIVDAVCVMMRNISMHFNGVAECAICYSVVCVADRSLPAKACKTCKHKFHAACLFKWFRTGGQSTCPLCRTLF